MAWTKISKKKNTAPLAASKDAHRDVLPRTGLGRGAQIVDSASKFLAGYGKVLMPAALLVIAGLTTWWILHTMRSSSELELRNKVDAAAAVAKFDELPGKMEVVIAETKAEGKLQAYAHYRYAIRAFELLDNPYKPEQVEKAVAILKDCGEQLSVDEQYKAWGEHVGSLHDRLSADLAFLEKPESAARLPWDHHTKFDRPKPKETETTPPINPVVVLVTSEGDLRIELFASAAANAAKNLTSLFGEGFYDRGKFTAASFSNHFSATGPYRGATVLTVGKEGRPIGVELKKPKSAKAEDDVDTEAAKNPYTIDYQGDTTQAFASGMIAMCRDDTPSKARSEFMVVLEPSPALNLNFSPLGKILGGEPAMEIARRLADAKIFYTYIEQKPKGDYLPQVHYDGWPVTTLKREKKPDPIRYGKLQQVIDATRNPLVVIETESGDILIELFEREEICPNTIKNFINLIEERFFDIDCEFYRILGTGTDIAEIYKSPGERIIQGGNSGEKARDKYDYYIRNEAVDNEKYDRKFGVDQSAGPAQGGIANARGTIAMARVGEDKLNGSLDGASTEFFINLKDHPNWDKKSSPYCVFGRVIEGLDLCARVAQGDLILSAKVIRKRTADAKAYVPTVKYKDRGVWIDKEAGTPPTEDAIKKAREQQKKDKEKKSDAPPSPSGPQSINIGG